MTNNRHAVWLLDEGHAGHRVQSEGILNALKGLGLSLEVTYVPCEPTLRGVFRPAARMIFSRLNARSALRFAKAVTQFSAPESGPPNFIVSSGGRTAFVSRALSLSTGAPSVFVGDPKPFPANWFNVVMSPMPLPSAPSAILTAIVPNNVTPALCQQKALTYWNGMIPNNCWALLIGGASRNHHYTAADWQSIAHGINSLAQMYGIKWLISTSRRTGREAETILETTLSPHAVEELVLYSSNPKPVVQPFLGAGRMVFVTQDSLTMLSEAVASGRYVVSLVPHRVDLAPDNFMAIMLRNFYAFPYFKPVPCAELARYSPLVGGDANNTFAEDALRQAAQQLHARIFV